MTTLVATGKNEYNQTIKVYKMADGSYKTKYTYLNRQSESETITQIHRTKIDTLRYCNLRHMTLEWVV